MPCNEYLTHAGLSLFVKIVFWAWHHVDRQLNQVLSNMTCRELCHFLHSSQNTHTNPETCLFRSWLGFEWLWPTQITSNLTAHRIPESAHVCLQAGTPYYVAPQVLQGKYDQVLIVVVIFIKERRSSATSCVKPCWSAKRRCHFVVIPEGNEMMFNTMMMMFISLRGKTY